jgi:hypothetical protein
MTVAHCERAVIDCISSLRGSPVADDPASASLPITRAVAVRHHHHSGCRQAAATRSGKSPTLTRHYPSTVAPAWDPGTPEQTNSATLLRLTLHFRSSQHPCVFGEPLHLRLSTHSTVMRLARRTSNIAQQSRHCAPCHIQQLQPAHCSRPAGQARLEAPVELNIAMAGPHSALSCTALAVRSPPDAQPALLLLSAVSRRTTWRAPSSAPRHMPMPC